MKEATLLIFFIFLRIFLTAQNLVHAKEYIDINNIKVPASSDGTLGYNGSINFDGFEFPKNSGKIMGAVNSLWVGGIDNGGNLHEAAMTYRQTGTDFFQGPIMNNVAYSSATDNQWNHLWKINKTSIDSFILFSQTGLPAGYVVPSTIINWPANGNVSLGESVNLAPYFDYNNDNFYNPYDGDYPLIKGDQAIFFLFNDDRSNHTETGSLKLGIEIQGMLYAFNCTDSSIQNTIYANYKILNKSSNNYDSMYIGNWLDLDQPGDNFFGTDVERGAYYFYSPNESLANSYGYNQPSTAVVFLNGPYADSTGLDEAIPGTPYSSGYGDGIIDNEKPGLGKSISFINSPSSNYGTPNSAQAYFNYLKGNWRNGTALKYGNDGYSGTLPCNYIFPGDSDSLSLGVSPSQPAWYNYPDNSTYADRRGVGSYGPFTFKSNQTVNIDLAFVIGRDYSDTSLSASISALKQRIDCARSFYESTFTVCNCQNITGINNTGLNSNLSIYPNPSTDLIYIDYKKQSKNSTVMIYDVKGQMIGQMKLENQNEQAVNIRSFAPGLYLMMITDGKNVDTQRFIKQ